MPANNRSAVSGGLNLSLESLGVNLPYSMEAEQAVLGAAILDADIIPKMVETLRPEMFYARQNGEIFSEIVRRLQAARLWILSRFWQRCRMPLFLRPRTRPRST